MNVMNANNERVGDSHCIQECKNCPISTNSRQIFFILIALRMNNVRLNFISFCTYFVGLGENVSMLDFSCKKRDKKV